MADIVLKNVRKSFGSVDVIKGIDLEAKHGEFVVFVGPSGCGKSTLLRMICGLERITSGHLFLDGEDMSEVEASDRGTAMVFQSYALYPHMTVAENMSFSMRMAKVDKSVIKKRVDQAADILQIKHLLDRKPKEMSGGQRQRVAIGRAIVRQPKVFLFDEPLSNLDAKLRVKMRIEITKLHRSLKASMIYVTHDQIEAMTMADKIVVLNAGRIEQVGAPLDLYRNPANRFVAGFIGSPAMNFFEGTVVEQETGSVTVDIAGGTQVVYPCAAPDQLAKGDAVTLGVRPEAFDLSTKTGPSVKGEVYAVERLGGETYLYLASEAAEEVVVHAVGDHEAAVGDVLACHFAPGACHLFDTQGQTVAKEVVQ